MSREQLIQALNEAAESLETISRDAGKVDTLESMYQVRPYAANRARAARAALSATQPAQAAQPVQGVQSETCPTCGESEPYSGACGTSSSDMRALCKRKAQAAQSDRMYLDGVNVERLMRALSVSGCACDVSREGVAADMAENINRLTAKVVNSAKAQAAQSDVAPGVMRCARCNFKLNRVTLYMGNGAVGAGDNKTEPCPNGCGPLWPVTWEQEARDAYKTCEDLFERAHKAEKQLEAQAAQGGHDHDKAAAMVSWVAHSLGYLRERLSSSHDVDSLNRSIGELYQAHALLKQPPAQPQYQMTATTEKLWCIHIPGPDDLYAAPSHEMAEHMAACHNAEMKEFFDRNPEKLSQWGLTVDECKAQVIEWTHGADEHAEDLADFDANEWALDEPAAIQKDQP